MWSLEFRGEANLRQYFETIEEYDEWYFQQRV